MAKKSRIPVHSKEELNAVASAAKAGDREALDRLFTMLRPYLVSILRGVDQTRYTREERAELDQAAALGVMEALSRFDSEAGTKFSTWAYPWVKGEVSEWLARNTGGLSMPRAAWHYAARIEEAWREVHGDTRTPHEATDAELAALHIEVTREGEAAAIQVPYAGDIFRARKDTYEVTPELLPSTDSPVEEEVLGADDPIAKRRGVSADQERATLVFIDSLDDLETEAWHAAAEDFINERRLPTTVEQLVGAAALLHGRVL